MTMPLQEIHQVYNALKIKDMPREAFVKQVQDLTSQSGVQRDLGVIMGRKRAEARNKMNIDRAIENGRG